MPWDDLQEELLEEFAGHAWTARAAYTQHLDASGLILDNRRTAAKPAQLKCVECGDEVPEARFRHGGRYCSKKCLRRADRRKLRQKRESNLKPRTCTMCSTLVPLARLKLGGITCSTACGKKHRSKTVVAGNRRRQMEARQLGGPCS